MEPGRSVMLVEDEPMIALMVEGMLEAQGFQVAAIFTRNAQALSFLCDQKPDVAIVDFSLADGKADPTARKLREQCIPFLIISGFNRSAANKTFDGVQWLEKPFSEEQFCLSLGACLNERIGSSAQV